MEIIYSFFFSRSIFFFKNKRKRRSILRCFPLNVAFIFGIVQNIVRLFGKNYPIAFRFFIMKIEKLR